MNILHLQDLPQTATADKLAQVLNEKEIRFKSCDVNLEEESKKCLSGTGSVTFQEKEDLVRLLSAMEELKLEGAPLKQRITQQGHFNPDSSIFISNINSSIIEADLIQTFKPFGPILSCMVVINRDTHQSKGIGFVDFANPENAKEAIAAMNNQRILNFSEKIHVQPY
eukprot:CAMPEP_0202959954 /NCGR_PEP_ID=MMETSP1396-20130829/4147_1 /ASSEMBLY_ACC=CAM_ASM_000872 /TAXON_ID= /ORGANISM="Pseudokeronopsis sp., Strain Brazil" /LENGTH=167 /DNA_ID=CAMNT_0049678871 /DNA_START=36 /DNA_END=539 /DNA_ORIENTATION=+